MSRFVRTGRGRSRSPIRRWSNAGKSKTRGKFDMDMSFTAPKWNLSELPKFEKCFYIEHPLSSARSEAEINSFRSTHKMTISGSDIPRPVFSFAELSIPDHTNRVIMKNGWQCPTPIQSQGLPMGLAGRDVVGIAQTGSGKTASFVIPALVHIAAQPRLMKGDGPICLILVPTRELAQQVLAVTREFAIAAGMRTMCFYGGSSRGPQKRDLQAGAEFCIATPGRLIDFLRDDSKLLCRVTYLVLDEADRMLDMGFEPQIRKIVAHIRPDRQTLMWSATWPREVQTLARDFLTNYIQVNIGSVSLHANPNITQIVEVVDEWNKEQRLVELLSMFGRARCLVFVETKRKTDKITTTLRRRGFAVGAMHGDKRQRERELTLQNFRKGRISVLVATDVASRGLDIDDIQFVINVDFPNQTEDYIHRIGRTARSDKKGTSFTFFSSKNQRQARELIDILEEARQEVNPELFRMAGISDSSRSSYRKKNQPFGSQPPGRFGNPPMGSTFHSGAPNFSSSDVRPPAFAGGSSGYQNGSSLHKSNSAAANLHSVGTVYPSGLKSGVPSDSAFTGTCEPAPGKSSSFHSFGASQLQGEIRASENIYGKPNVTIFNPSASGGLPSGSSTRWDRHAPPVQAASQVPLPNDQLQQPMNNSNWNANQWTDPRNVSGTQGNWNIAPATFTPNSSNFPQQAVKPPSNRRPSAEIPNQIFTQDNPGSLPSRGFSGNSKGNPLPPPATYPQQWPNFPQQAFPQNPIPNQPNAPNWGPTWGQPYYGNF